MPRKSVLETVKPEPEIKGVIRLEDAKLIESYGGALSSSRANLASDRTFYNQETNLTVRSSFARSDYEAFRPAERIPRDINGLITVCMSAYDNIGIVNNVINLMSDFTASGAELVHSIKSQEKFWQRWFEKVNGKERSSAIVNMLYRAGNVVVQRVDGDLPLEESVEWKKIGGAKTYKIPLKYVIHNPLGLQVYGGQVAGFLDQPYFMLKISSEIMTGLQQLKANSGMIGKDVLESILSKIPKEFLQPNKQNNAYIPLDQEELYPYYFKRDDGQIWAKPIVAPVLTDLFNLAKLKLADTAALDGVISNIRLWRLGHLTDNVATTILPTRTGINKLRNIIATNVGGGVFDLVWGPELDFKESNTQTHNFLGSDKYQATWNAIYEGLGIPPTLTGTGGSGGGFTNNSIALKTLIDRLEYGRNVLMRFWNEQIRLVQAAMGFAKAPKVSFAQMSLSDESSIKALLIQLADRDIISNEALQRAFGYVPESQNAQIKRESKKRNAKVMPPKASPYHNPQTLEDMKKIILQGGGVAPSELGIELEKKQPGQLSQLEKNAKLNPKPIKQFDPPSTNNGRPKNKKDSTKRKQRTVKPRAFIENFMWANNAQHQISEILTPIIVQSLGKKNVRQLSNDETDSLEVIKFSTLCGLEPYSEISEEKLYNLIEEKVPSWASLNFNKLKSDFVTKNHREPTVEESRQIQSSSYAIHWERENG